MNEIFLNSIHIDWLYYFGPHILVTSLVGLAKARRTLIGHGLWEIILIWFLIFPLAAFLAITLYFPISAFF